MAKQKTTQKFIYKLHSSTLKKAKFDLELSLKTAISHKTDIIALADSQCLRFIDEINGVDTDQKAKEKKKEIKIAKKNNEKEKLKKLYEELYSIRFQKDYVCIIMDSKGDYDECNKGFFINNIHYRRLLGTNGGIKNSTIIYVSDGHKTNEKYKGVYDKLKEKLDCGRNKSVPIIAAKLEAYQALMCSGSVPVSMPNGIIVVKDCITKFKSKVINIDDTETDEPKVEVIEKDVELIDSDGYGFMLPSLSRRWNKELGGDENETLSGVNTRGIPWTKGMLFTFDFVEFGEKVAKDYFITDVWGQKRDVREAEVILTEGMLKLWSSYDNYEDFISNVEKYNYQFAIAKTAPHKLENERCTNYQFLQSYELSDEDIKELVSPTTDEIKEVIGLNVDKSILFLNGSKIEDSYKEMDDDFKKALLIEPKMIDDPFVRNVLYNSIKKKIKQAKIGVLKVHANFAIIGGDLYSLAQSMFGLEVTGLLKAGECYHKFWSDQGVKDIVCFRAPMTSHNNIRKMNPMATEEMQHWYKYVKTCMLLNSWDTTCEALNGADKDGDLFYTTDNKVLVNKYRELLSVNCVQRKAEKIIPTERDIIRANKVSFGDAIGATTNTITSQICLQAEFNKDSEEYKELDKRILCGQLYQQNEIDKAKGIIVKEMPTYWKNNAANKIKDEDISEEIDKKLFNQRICADKKPYFFIYNYSHLLKQYNKYIDNNNSSSIRRFGKSLSELLESENRNEEENIFVEWYYKMMPVINTDCTMNNICRFVESQDFKLSKNFKNDFDTSIIKSVNAYDENEYKKIKKKLCKVYDDYNKKVHEFNKELKSDKNANKESKEAQRDHFKEEFKLECAKCCKDETMLCDILIDICYSSSSSKQFVWDISGEQIIKNLLLKHDNIISFPVLDDEGDIVFCGKKYSKKTIKLEEVDD